MRTSHKWTAIGVGGCALAALELYALTGWTCQNSTGFGGCSVHKDGTGWWLQTVWVQGGGACENYEGLATAGSGAQGRCGPSYWFGAEANNGVDAAFASSSLNRYSPSTVLAAQWQTTYCDPNVEDENGSIVYGFCSMS